MTETYVFSHAIDFAGLDVDAHQLKDIVRDSIPTITFVEFDPDNADIIRLEFSKKLSVLEEAELYEIVANWDVTDPTEIEK